MLELESTAGRPETVAFASGRAFYALDNQVLYSQVVEGNSLSFLNKCHQKNDPTSSEISDILDTDGGIIPINSARKIRKLVEYRNGVLVFASNGVWHVRGSDGGFTATGFTVQRLSSIGCISPDSVLPVDESVLYWSEAGIYRVAPNEFGEIVTQSLTEESIQTFYEAIPVQSKRRATGAYDSSVRRVEWLYSSQSPSLASAGYSRDKGLIMDLRTGGFFPVQYNSSLEEGGTHLVNPVEKITGSDESELVFLYTVSIPGTSWEYGFCKRSNQDFQDFGEFYQKAYFKTGHETLQRPSHKKGSPYVTTHMLKTETGYEDEEGNLTLQNPSSCLLSASWDWHLNSNSNRTTNEQQVYRHSDRYIPSSDGDDYDTGAQTVVMRSRLRGRGQSMSLNFNSEDGKDMQVLGYTVAWHVTGRL